MVSTEEHDVPGTGRAEDAERFVDKVHTYRYEEAGQRPYFAKTTSMTCMWIILTLNFTP
jgi:hypothetical protein